MLRKLLSVLRDDSLLHAIGKDFVHMLGRAESMTSLAGEIYTRGAPKPDRKRLYDLDLEVNLLERDIRKQIAAHLTMPGNSSDAAFCLRLMILVKDVERIGDYAKNLAELDDLRHDPLPEDAIVSDLLEIRQAVETSFRDVAETVATSDRDRAMNLIPTGRRTAQQCDGLVRRISRATYGTSTTVVLVLGARYYKRINGHLLNLLSSVVMPVHKIDYHDEDEIPQPASHEEA